MLDLAGTSSVVTGGASGIGEATARQLAERGARVVILDMNEDRGTKVAAELGGVFVNADVAEPAQVIPAIDAALELGPLRTLVCCAGIGSAWRTVGKDGEYASAHDLDLFAWILRVNLLGAFNCIRLAATAMSRLDPVDEHGERGAIVTIASCAAFDGQVGQAAYSAAKGGIHAMTLPIARDLTPIGVRINCVAPGVIDTPILDGHPTKTPEQLRTELSRDVLFPKRLGRPEELASTILHLLTNSYANAETVRLDAGARMRAK